MDSWWQVVLSVLGGLVLLWVALLVLLHLAARSQEPARLGEALRLAPDVVRLARRLAADPVLPRGVRIRLGVLLAYLLLPIDLVPSLRYVDDAILVALVLRSVVRAAGAEGLDRHWPGTPEGLRAVKRLAGLGQAGRSAACPSGDVATDREPGAGDGKRQAVPRQHRPAAQPAGRGRGRPRVRHALSGRLGPYFRDYMTLLEVYHYPTQHYDHHRRQLTLGGAR